MLNIDRKVYDIIGIGIGPFNLGLAAMVDVLPQLSCVFFDQSKEFNWHAGMLLPNARLQVPFYADLVTVVDPCSRFTYLNFLKEKQRLFRFAIHENNFITRKEYNAYCQWVVGQLDHLYFNHKVVDIHFDVREDVYTVMVHNLLSDQLLFYYAKHLVIGVGTVPYVPECVKIVSGEMSMVSGEMSSGREIGNLDINCCLKAGDADQGGIASSHGYLTRRVFDKAPRNDGGKIIHSSEYLFHKNSVLERSKIAIVGSGQSAAEIFYDILNYTDHLESLCWFTRSPRFFPMEYSKLSLEMTSPDYIDHFYSLSPEMKKEVLRKQDVLYKGINFSLINEIYDALYLKGLEQDTSCIAMHTNVALNDVEVDAERIRLELFHHEQGEGFTHETDVVILATGYRNSVPFFMDSIKEQVEWMDDGFFNVARNYSIDKTGKGIFVQNAELHSHGFSAPDLGMGPYRNATILNSILGYEHFVMERNVTFQRFGIDRG